MLYGYPIKVLINKGLICITNDAALKYAAMLQPLAFAKQLVNWTQEDHQETYGETIAINNHSFIAEIWGHLYFEYCLLKYSAFGKFIFPFGLYRRFLRSCEVIDCGERGRDPNRRLWDKLVPIRGWLGRRLAKAMHDKFRDIM